MEKRKRLSNTLNKIYTSKQTKYGMQKLNRSTDRMNKKDENRSPPKVRKEDIVTQAPAIMEPQRDEVIQRVAEYLKTPIDDSYYPTEICIYNPFIYNDWISSNPMKLRSGKNFEANLQCYTDLRENLATPKMLLPSFESKKTLVLDLDETLVHSSFASTPEAQIIVPIEINGNILDIYVQIRPGAKYFIEEVSKIYEVIIYTASISRYAQPLIRQLDPKELCKYHLYREHCTICGSSFVKDLAFLGRDLKDVIIIDNSPNAYAFQQENAIPISSWYNDLCDTSLYQILPILLKLSKVEDVREYLPRIVQNDKLSMLSAYKVLGIDFGIKHEYEELLNTVLNDSKIESVENAQNVSNTPNLTATLKSLAHNGDDSCEEQGNGRVSDSNRIGKEVVLTNVKGSHPKKLMINTWASTGNCFKIIADDSINASKVTRKKLDKLSSPTLTHRRVRKKLNRSQDYSQRSLGNRKYSKKRKSSCKIKLRNPKARVSLASSREVNRHNQLNASHYLPKNHSISIFSSKKTQKLIRIPTFDSKKPRNLSKTSSKNKRISHPTHKPMLSTLKTPLKGLISSPNCRLAPSNPTTHPQPSLQNPQIPQISVSFTPCDSKPSKKLQKRRKKKNLPHQTISMSNPFKITL
ncbi:unnamed protein product [Moneuplotes crassus]|uniref:FCP1 homology domain-containing protein n=1 Tax=Euplotes crassus TaxID=5936 RepID=A0AAD1U1F3_EUPCR|nr:unnamed protein product [Moneuplotes crassus]